MALAAGQIDWYSAVQMGPQTAVSAVQTRWVVGVGQIRWAEVVVEILFVAGRMRAVVRRSQFAGIAWLAVVAAAGLEHACWDQCCRRSL